MPKYSPCLSFLLDEASGSLGSSARAVFRFSNVQAKILWWGTFLLGSSELLKQPDEALRGAECSDSFIHILNPLF